MITILVDPYTTEFPDDVLAAARGKSVALSTAEQVVPVPPSAMPILDRWDVKTHKYRQEIAVKIGFLAGLFSGTGKKVSAGVIHEAKRYCIQQTAEGRKFEVGVSVRLSVATTAVNIEFELSIPNLAASAQLGQSDARIGISVIGFVGPVGDLLPAPEDLNVENFAVFTNAAKDIQKRVFGPEGVSFLMPTVLSYDE